MTERGIATHRIGADTNVIEKIVTDLKPGDIFVDVGANIGWISLNAARQVGPAGRVIAIEPIAELRRRMAFNAASNGFDNITIVGSAVGDETGETRFHVNPSQQGMSSIAAQDGYQTIRVPVTTLAEIVRKAGISRIDAIKMDAEGHEDRIILPLIKSEPKSLWPKKIFLEIRHADRWKTDCISRLTEAGYKRVWFDHSDALMQLDPQPSPH
jgi:FkbM family methyltransferase